MSPIWVEPPAVTPAHVRRLSGDGAQAEVAVQRVQVPLVPAPSVVPRQSDAVALRLMALQLENDRLRAELERLRAG